MSTQTILCLTPINRNNPPDLSDINLQDLRLVIQLQAEISALQCTKKIMEKEQKKIGAGGRALYKTFMDIYDEVSNTYLELTLAEEKDKSQIIANDFDEIFYRQKSFGVAHLSNVHIISGADELTRQYIYTYFKARKFEELIDLVTSNIGCTMLNRCLASKREKFVKTSLDTLDLEVDFESRIRKKLTGKYMKASERLARIEKEMLNKENL